MTKNMKYKVAKKSNRHNDRYTLYPQHFETLKDAAANAQYRSAMQETEYAVMQYGDFNDLWNVAIYDCGELIEVCDNPFLSADTFRFVVAPTNEADGTQYEPKRFNNLSDAINEAKNAAGNISVFAIDAFEENEYEIATFFFGCVNTVLHGWFIKYHIPMSILY